MDLEHELLAMERLLWTNDAAIYESSLLEDAVLVFAETGVIRREPALAAIRQENADGRRWAEVQFDDVLTLRLAQDAALPTYRATAQWANVITNRFRTATRQPTQEFRASVDAWSSDEKSPRRFTFMVLTPFPSTVS